MKNKINLYWYKHKDGYGNFGDELNPYIVSRISSTNLRHFDAKVIFESKYLALKTFTYQILKNEISFESYLKYLYYNFISQPNILFGIGSILQYTTLKKLDVWGSGIVKKDAFFSNANFLAVRGKYTQNRLRELGYTVPDVIGDPAILLPLIYSANHSKKYKIGIIPHYVHFEEYKQLENENTVVINLLDPIEKIIDEINACGITLSSSLHGIIVSHIYGVPSVWSCFKELEINELAGDNVKFKDYFSSLNIENYEPIQFTREDFEMEIQGVSDKIKEVPDKLLIKEIQKNLLRVAPFPTNNFF